MAFSIGRSRSHSICGGFQRHGALISTEVAVSSGDVVTRRHRSASGSVGEHDVFRGASLTPTTGATSRFPASVRPADPLEVDDEFRVPAGRSACRPADPGRKFCATQPDSDPGRAPASAQCRRVGVFDQSPRTISDRHPEHADVVAATSSSVGITQTAVTAPLPQRAIRLPRRARGFHS